VGLIRARGLGPALIEAEDEAPSGMHEPAGDVQRPVGQSLGQMTTGLLELIPGVVGPLLLAFRPVSRKDILN